MATAIQPGRIEPKQMPNKIPGSVSSTKNKLSEAQEIARDPAGAITNKALGVVSDKVAASDAKKRLNKQLGQAHKNERVPVKPQYRLTLFEGGVLIGISAFIDLVDWIAGWFAEIVIGEVIVIVIDILYGILIACYCRFRLKLPFTSHIPIYLSVLGAELIGFVPLINAFWWADAWYIVHTIRAEDRATFDALVQTIQQEREADEREKWMTNYAQQQQVDDQEKEDITPNNNGEGRINPPQTKPKTYNSNTPAGTPGRITPSPAPLKISSGNMAT